MNKKSGIIKEGLLVTIASLLTLAVAFMLYFLIFMVFPVNLELGVETLDMVKKLNFSIELEKKGFARIISLDGINTQSCSNQQGKFPL